MTSLTRLFKVSFYNIVASVLVGEEICLKTSVLGKKCHFEKSRAMRKPAYFNPLALEVDI